MYKKALILIILSALLFSACAASATPTAMQSAYDLAAPMAPSAEMEGKAFEVPASEPAPEPARGSLAAQTQPEAKRIVIKNASISLVVPDPMASMDRLSAMTEEMGGFVVNAQVYQRRVESGAEASYATLTVRVPAERLNEALQRIEAETTRPLVNKNIDSEDVTSAYVDLQSRQRNLEAAEEQLQEIMASARKTEEVLDVYNRLVQVREQIEVIKGQIQYYDQAAALSSINIQLTPDAAVQPLTIAGWEPGGVAKEAAQALINSMRSLAKIGIWAAVYVLPLLVVLLLPFVLLFFAVRAYRRRSRRGSMPVS